MSVRQQAEEADNGSRPRQRPSHRQADGRAVHPSTPRPSTTARGPDSLAPPGAPTRHPPRRGSTPAAANHAHHTMGRRPRTGGTLGTDRATALSITMDGGGSDNGVPSHRHTRPVDEGDEHHHARPPPADRCPSTASTAQHSPTTARAVTMVTAQLRDAVVDHLRRAQTRPVTQSAAGGIRARVRCGGRRPRQRPWRAQRVRRDRPVLTPTCPRPLTSTCRLTIGHGSPTAPTAPRLLTGTECHLPEMAVAAGVTRQL
jgi:hypothetical protein